MQKFKKFVALALATTMVFGASLTAFAEDPVTSGGTDGAGTSEGHVDQELINVVLPTVPSGSTPFAYTMDPERLIQETDAAKYAEGTVFPDSEGDTGVYFLTTENTYANTSNTLQAINKSSCAITLTVKVKTTQNTAKDIALATSSEVATEGTPNLYLGLKVGNDTTVVKAEEQSVVKTIAGTPDNFEIAVNEGAYVYREKASATTWKAMNLNMTGAVSHLAVASDTTAPTVNVTWEYEKAGENATAATDAVDYTTVVADPYESAEAIALTKGSTALYANFADLGFTANDITATVVQVDGGEYETITRVDSETALKFNIVSSWNTASSVKIFVNTSDGAYVYTYK